MTQFTDQQRRLLGHRIERLMRLLELNAPQTVLDMSAALTIRGIICVVGPGAFAHVAQYIIHETKEGAGLCPFHDDVDNPISEQKTPHGDSWGMCDDCLNQAQNDDDEAARIEAEEYEASR